MANRLNTEESQLVQTALRIAADQWTSDSKENPEVPSLVAQFERQAKMARALADRLED